ncbi:MAG: T9SS type A sorting domain-containing protein [Atribacterota bacterium]|nr:T9SS type A sorting domain-containing protein [Atribacterota bacterium]
MYHKRCLVLSLVFSFLFALTPIAFSDELSITLTGRAFIPVVTEKGEIAERFFAFAPLEVIDLETGQVVAEDSTKVNGRYSVAVENPGLYLVRFKKGNRVILDISPRIRWERRTYDLGYADARSTALALVLLNLSAGKKDPTTIVVYKTSRILRSERFKDLENLVRKTLALGESVEESREIRELVETIASPLRES